MDREAYKIFYPKLAYKLIELPNFVLKERELSTDLEKWLFILKNMSHLKKIPVYLRKPIFQQVFQIAEMSALTKEERMAYDASLKAKKDWNNTVAWAAEQAAKKAAETEKRKIALELKKLGISVDDISKATGFSVGEIEELK